MSARFEESADAPAERGGSLAADMLEMPFLGTTEGKAARGRRRVEWNPAGDLRQP